MAGSQINTSNGMPKEYDLKTIADMVIENLSNKTSSMTKLNIMVFGKTGVGKSTLINSIFNENVTETGIGRPVTDRIKRIEVSDKPLVIYDSPGLELGGDNSTDGLIAEVDKIFRSGIESGDTEKMIHCVLYCVSSPSHRFEDSEKDFIKRFLDSTSRCHVPVIIVLTQSYLKKDADELALAIKKENLNVAQIIPVLAQDYIIDANYKVSAYGLEKLAEIILNVMPQAAKDTFITLQQVNIKMKQKKAHAVVAASATAAGGIAVIPIPLSDAAMLVPEQVAMLTAVTAVFGLPVEKTTIYSILSATLGTTGATVVGKSLFTSLLKLIPYAGSAVGGALSAALASVITLALGEAYIAVLTKVAEGEMKMSDLESRKGKKLMTNIFKDNLKMKRTAEDYTLTD